MEVTLAQPNPFKAVDTAGHYHLETSVNANEILKMANYLSKHFLKKGTDLNSSEQCFAYLQAILQDREQEVFGVILLDQHHRVISYKEMFTGTINQASFYGFSYGFAYSF